MDNPREEKDFDMLATENQRLREQLDEQEKRLKQYGDELQTALNQYETLFHEAPAGYVFIDAQYKIRKPSDTFCRLLNQSRFYFIGKDLFDYVYPDYRGALNERLGMAFLMNTPQKPLLIKLQSDSRRAFWVEIKFQPAPYEDRAERLMLLSVHDVDNLAEFEQKLRRSDARARLLLNSSSDGAFLITPDGVLLDSNRKFESYADITSIENRNYSLYDYFTDAQYPERRLRIDKMLAEKKPYVINDTFANRNFEIRVHPFLDESEEVEYIAVFVKETTEKRLLEEKINFQSANIEDEVKKRMGEVYGEFERLKSQIAASEAAQSKLRENESLARAAYESLAKREALIETVAAHLTELLESDDIEEVIYRMFVSVGERTSADRVYLFKRSYDPAEEIYFYFVYEEWTAPGKKALREFDEMARIYLARDFVGWEEAFLDKDAVSGGISSFDARIREFLQLTKTKSLLALPVYVAGEFWGFVGFDNLSDEENWKTGESAALSIIADSIGGAFERRERVRQMNEQKALLETMIENLPVAVFAKDASTFKNIIWNKAAERLAGVDKNYAIGRSNFELFPLNAATNYHRQDLEALGSGNLEEINEEIIMNANGEEKIVRSQKLLIKDSKGTPKILLGISLDITDSVKSERELKLYAEELENAKKTLEENADKLARAAAELEIAKVAAERANRAKGEFLANMSHELRTPMNSILGFTELLQELATDAKMREYLSYVESNGKSLLSLMNDILDVSRIETGKIELNLNPVDLTAIIDDVMRMYAGRAREKRLELRSEISDDFPQLAMADEIKFRQIMFNLVGNAIKFTDKGYVAVRARRLNSAAPGEGEADIVIEVIDTGIGIDPEEKERIFDSFYQPANQDSVKYGGAGLGLAIVKKLVEAMNGSIQANNKPSGGSSFRVTLRNVRLTNAFREAINKPKESELDLKTDFAPSKTLFICDSESESESLGAYLEHTNIILTAIPNASEALREIMKSKPDIIFADISTIISCGFDPAKYAQSAKNLCSSPVVAVINSSTDGGGAQLEAFDGVLKNSFSRSDLIAVLRRFLKYEIPTGAAPTNGKSAKIADPQTVKLAESQLMPAWEKIRKTVLIERTQEFAQMNIEAGAKFSIAELRTYGEELLALIDSSNVVGIRELLQKYEGVFLSLKNDSE